MVPYGLIRLFTIWKGAPAQAVVSLQDVSEQYEREIAYKKWEKIYAALPQDSIAYLEFDLTMNRFEKARGGLTGVFPAGVERTLEESMRYFCDRWVFAEDRARLRAYAARERLLTEYFGGGDAGEAEYRHQRGNGTFGWVRVSAQMLPDPYCSKRPRIPSVSGYRRAENARRSPCATA